MENDKIKLKGECTIKRIDLKTGKVLDTEIHKNIIVNTGKTNVAKLLFNISTNFAYTAILIGTGTETGAPLATDTTLIEFLDSAIGDVSYEADYKGVINHLFTFEDDYTITEAAVAKDTDNTDLLNHVIFETPKEVDSVTGLDVTFKITVA